MVRDGRCYFCPKQTDLEDHHVIPQRFGGPDSDENIVRLCNRCHDKLEQLYDKSFYEWFGINDDQGTTRFHRPCNQPGKECDKTAEVKFSLRPGSKPILRCQKHAAISLVKAYIRIQNHGLHTVSDSITEYWENNVQETVDGVGRPEYLEQYYSDMVANREFL